MTGVAEIGDRDGRIVAVDRHRPDLSVVDVLMPSSVRHEGLRAALAGRRRLPGLTVLVLCEYVEERYASELLAGDAARVGYVLQDRVADGRDFVVTVRASRRASWCLIPSSSPGLWSGAGTWK